MNLKELIPNNWKSINEANYKYIGINSSSTSKCLGAFTIEENNSIVVFTEYPETNINFLKDLDNTLAKINEINEVFDGSPASKNYKDTSLVSNIFRGFTVKNEKNLYLNINKVIVSENLHTYSFQVFVEADNCLYCASSSVLQLDENNVLESAFESKHIKRIVNILLDL